MEFQGQFTEAVNCLRIKNYHSDVIFNYPHDHEEEDQSQFQTDDDTTMVFHDEALLPHWREIAQACKLFSFILLYRSAICLQTYHLT